MKSITRTEAAKIIRSTNGKLFSVNFLKANNQPRKLTGRTGVKAHTKGGVSTIADKPDLIGVYEMGNKQQYRCFSINRLLELKANGETYKVEDK